MHLGQFTKVRLSCYLVLLSVDTKTRWQDSRTLVICFVIGPTWHINKKCKKFSLSTCHPRWLEMVSISQRTLYQIFFIETFLCANIQYERVSFVVSFFGSDGKNLKILFGGWVLIFRQNTKSWMWDDNLFVRIMMENCSKHELCYNGQINL